MIEDRMLCLMIMPIYITKMIKKSGSNDFEPLNIEYSWNG
tara:strand:+ start:32949 stop:33068 length:120 start_codon:yes stop_codon:yes gene_type:complete